MQHLEGIKQIFLNTFIKQEPVTAALGMPPRVASWYAAHVFGDAVSRGDIFVALDQAGEVAGFTMAVPDGMDIPVGEDTKAMFRVMREPLRKIYGEEEGLHCLYVAVAEKYFGKGVHRVLAEKNIERARQGGYPFIYAECTSERSARTCIRLGYETALVLPYSEMNIPAFRTLEGACRLCHKKLTAVRQ